MQRLPQPGETHTYNIIIVNSNGSSQPPSGQLHQALDRAGGYHHPEMVTALLHQEASHQARRSLPICSLNRPMVASVLHHSRPLTAPGPLLPPVDYFYDLGQMYSLDHPSSRMEVAQYSNPGLLTLQSVAAQMPQVPDFHFSLHILLPSQEHSVHLQQPPVTFGNEGSHFFYATLPIPVWNVACPLRSYTSSGSQPSQPQMSAASPGNADAPCASFRQAQDAQITGGFPPEPVGTQRHPNFTSAPNDPDATLKSKASDSKTNADPALDSTSCIGNPLPENGEQYLNTAPSSSQETEPRCEKSDGVLSNDPKEGCEKVMVTSFEDAVTMFDFELFDNPKSHGQVSEQEQYFREQNKVRNENNQKNLSQKIPEDHFPEEGNPGSSEIEAELCLGIKTLVAKVSPLCAEALSTIHIATSDHSFYDLRPEQVDLQTLLELEDISDDERCWESLGCKSQLVERSSQLGVEALPRSSGGTSRKRERTRSRCD
ncbi:uncharacterized protein [Narcine bancroftii]|uniref:uncharacterized protein n=1 Tax=Narcine bancroftii TaxID=1343680 RepID=UPI00383215D2